MSKDSGIQSQMGSACKTIIISALCLGDIHREHSHARSTAALRHMQQYTVVASLRFGDVYSLGDCSEGHCSLLCRSEEAGLGHVAHKAGVTLLTDIRGCHLH